MMPKARPDDIMNLEQMDPIRADLSIVAIRAFEFHDISIWVN
jgi:hypothetical protein